jgi:hypothetical protein
MPRHGHARLNATVDARISVYGLVGTRLLRFDQFEQIVRIDCNRQIDM